MCMRNAVSKGWRGNVVWLAMGRADEALAHVDSVALSHGAFHLHHYYELLARSQINLYLRQGAEAWEAVRDLRAKMKPSLMLRIQSVRIEGSFIVARGALAAAATTKGTERSRLLAEVGQMCQAHRKRANALGFANCAAHSRHGVPAPRR